MSNYEFLDIHNDDLTVIGRHPIGVPVYEINYESALARHHLFITEQIRRRKDKENNET